VYLTPMRRDSTAATTKSAAASELAFLREAGEVNWLRDRSLYRFEIVTTITPPPPPSSGVARFLCRGAYCVPFLQYVLSHVRIGRLSTRHALIALIRILSSAHRPPPWT